MRPARDRVSGRACRTIAEEDATWYPYGLLTMIVSLEAIFLSTFVMISQNRADAKREIVADQQWQTVQLEDKQNEELLALSHQILDLTKQVHAFASRQQAVAEGESGGRSTH